MQLEQAEDAFRQALALDPKFALAYAGLCERYATGYDETRDPALVSKAESACGAALKLDDSLREVSAALAHLYLVSGRSDEAAARYRAAIRAEPDSADGYMGLGEALEAASRTPRPSGPSARGSRWSPLTGARRRRSATSSSATAAPRPRSRSTSA